MGTRGYPKAPRWRKPRKVKPLFLGDIDKFEEETKQAIRDDKLFEQRNQIYRFGINGHHKKYDHPTMPSYINGKFSPDHTDVHDEFKAGQTEALLGVTIGTYPTGQLRIVFDSGVKKAQKLEIHRTAKFLAGPDKPDIKHFQHALALVISGIGDKGLVLDPSNPLSIEKAIEVVSRIFDGRSETDQRQLFGRTFKRVFNPVDRRNFLRIAIKKSFSEEESASILEQFPSASD